ncbi:hypothetical protein J2X65_004913 [Ancylobacter sp. 3268]|uniref:nuclear transport factor 2 family protein n=1 Tax=Ancylobacter sp. 3268 TaxID=2817752 RepID=UPI0028607036|nr:nuclear transport factor 2 family protein [Ancylobacter sp. 3268]MDR6955533.1 hypothetical protein [Ancylobacter sp. 3268]
MSDPGFPLAVQSLLNAVRSGSREGILAAFAADHVIEDKSHGPPSRDLRHWVDQLLSNGIRSLRVMHREPVSDGLRLVILIHCQNGRIDGPLYWKVLYTETSVYNLSIETIEFKNVPEYVREFVVATNIGDLSSILRIFTDDALVNDEFVEYIGREDISIWARRSIIDRQLGFHILRLFTQEQRVVVSVSATGKFDMMGLPDPLILTLYFSLSGNGIAQLIILQNVQT